jgi:DNA-binding transcriptional MerR regulator
MHLVHGSSSKRSQTKTNGKAAVRSRRAHNAEEIVIPEKLYFRIGEVADLCRLPAYVLRFWESEFSHLKPTKSSTGQRMYRRRDVEAVLRIKDLLYNQGFTIAGARQALRDEVKTNRSQSALPFPTSQPAPSRDLKPIRRELKQLLDMLSR